MLIILVFFSSFSFSCTKLSSSSRCSGCPAMYNGLPCGSTTVYSGGGSACGCSEQWSQDLYTVAPNQKFMRNSRDGSTWCADRCGECIRLTTTGGYIQGMSPDPTGGVTITAMIVDLCPEGGNWCSQSKGFLECFDDNDCESHTNQYGYNVHFDIHNDNNQITSGLGWDNVEVTWERIACHSESPETTPGTPGIPNWKSCQCNGEPYNPTHEIAMCWPWCTLGLSWCHDYNNQCYRGDEPYNGFFSNKIGDRKNSEVVSSYSAVVAGFLIPISILSVFWCCCCIIIFCCIFIIFVVLMCVFGILGFFSFGGIVGFFGFRSISTKKHAKKSNNFNVLEEKLNENDSSSHTIN